MGLIAIGGQRVSNIQGKMRHDLVLLPLVVLGLIIFMYHFFLSSRNSSLHVTCPFIFTLILGDRQLYAHLLNE